AICALCRSPRCIVTVLQDDLSAAGPPRHSGDGAPRQHIVIGELRERTHTGVPPLPSPARRSVPAVAAGGTSSRTHAAFSWCPGGSLPGTRDAVTPPERAQEARSCSLAPARILPLAAGFSCDAGSSLRCGPGGTDVVYRCRHTGSYRPGRARAATTHVLRQPRDA